MKSGIWVHVAENNTVIDTTTLLFFSDKACACMQAKFCVTLRRVVSVCDRDDSCLCHVSGTLISEFEDDLTAISSHSEENDLSQLCEYLTVGRGQVILHLLSITGIVVRMSAVTGAAQYL